MKAVDIKKAQKTHPTGDPKFSVMQAFPSGIPAEEADPFLMCDHFGPTLSTGLAKHPDDFPIGWHPHRGIDILTYMKEGKGRHADSLGNREEFNSPGMQWISVGSGIEHAEGGANPTETTELGFQIWVNVPGKHKMDDPRYGTEPPEKIPVINGEGVKGLLLAGSIEDKMGPFKTVQPVQMVDYELSSNAQLNHLIPSELDNCLIYVYKGSGKITDNTIPMHHVVRLDCSNPNNRLVDFKAGSDGMSVLIFAGKRINEPIAWHGPFVMNTDEEINRTMKEYRSGNFLKKRVPWDFKKIASQPIEVTADQTSCGAK